MIRRPPRSTQSRSSAASDVYKRQGPDVIKTVTGEDVGMEELGGALTHNKISGVAHYLASDEADALDYARTLLSYLPDNNLAELPVFDSEVELETTDADLKLNFIIPDSPNQPYDVKTVIEHIVDNGDFLETQPLFAPCLLYTSDAAD